MIMVHPSDYPDVVSNEVIRHAESENYTLLS